MKRIHVFEFEDFQWFPKFLRVCLTNYIVTFHRLLDSAANLTILLTDLLSRTNSRKIVDLCSGGGGPMLWVYDQLKAEFPDLQLTMTDLYPNATAVKRIGQEGPVTYQPESVDAGNVSENLDGIRTMICSMHHMRPEGLKDILANAQEANQPFLGYEISDNSFPKAIWWIAFPINIISVLLVTPLVRPMTWQQLVFTYLIPILPLLIAWDGAVSNARTYTLKDMDLILSDLPKTGYLWETGAMEGKGGKKLYLKGIPS
ncbi:hypothetical protein [Marinoscillum sp.]|uniref:hypothetical protein n=1 Tax=Marinoscillum sp. TaxID=2024838 RepID=UPI003BA8C05E